ncbi:MAG: imelysin family protein, partial [Methyloligellaceae bacterium]
IVKQAQAGQAYDQLIGEGNGKGNQIVQKAIDSLIAQAREFQRIASTLEVKSIAFEGSDSLDAPDKVQ